MPWTPVYEEPNARAIADNLLTFFEANQVDAILWAHGSALKPLARFENSVADPNNPAYPAIYLITDADGEINGNDMAEGSYSVTFLLMVQATSPATATARTRSYVKAVKSMIKNISHSALAANTELTVGAIVLQSIETAFGAIKAGSSGDANNNWLQDAEIRANFTYSGSAYA